MTRKILLLLFSPFVLGCETNSEPNPYQVVIDSTVNAKVAQYQAKMASKNDSLLILLENARADSMARSQQAAKNTKPIPNNTVPPNKIGNTGFACPKKIQDTLKH